MAQLQIVSDHKYHERCRLSRDLIRPNITGIKHWSRVKSEKGPVRNIQQDPTL